LLYGELLSRKKSEKNKKAPERVYARGFFGVGLKVFDIMRKT
jgi:hypothetical protein